MTERIIKADAIAAAVVERLKRITRDNGFFTDAGVHVWRGRPVIDESRLPSITLFESEDLIEQQRLAATQGEAEEGKPVSIDTGILLPLVIELTSKCDPDNPSIAAHQLVADAKRAIFAGDLTWGGLAQFTRYIGRQFGVRKDGTDLVSAEVRIRIGYLENLADPRQPEPTPTPPP